MRAAWLGEALRAYTRRTPVPRGRDRLALWARALGAGPGDGQLVRSRQGLVLRIDPDEDFYQHAYFTGEYEPGLSRVLRAVASVGDVCVDGGANIGWHTVHLAQAVGPTGHVHAFEPSPRMHGLLAGNVARNGFGARVTTHHVGLMADAGTRLLRQPARRSAAHASVAESAGEGEGDRVHVEPLATVLARVGATRCDLIKLDVEGAEREALAGAGALLGGPVPPVLVVEAAAQTAARFGYTPNDLLDDLDRLGTWRVFLIDEASGGLTPLARFPAGHIGANILIVPEARADRVVHGVLAQLISGAVKS
jgi:FkbM family methyltransferase